MSTFFLAMSATWLLFTILVQNILYPPLREETISDGLYGPYHWWLDGAYVILATALAFAFRGRGLSETLALGAGGALMVTAVTNTFSTWVDKLKPGLHIKLHSWFSVIMFLTMLGLEATQDRGWLWWLSGAGIVVPIGVFGACQLFKKLGIAGGPAAEKTAVFLLCSWLVAWSLGA